MRIIARLLILSTLSGCKSFHQPAEEPPARRPAVETFLHGRPSLTAERAADLPRQNAYWDKQRRFPDLDPGYPWQWAPSR